MSAFIGPSVSISNTIMSYFNPSKSPFYGVIAFGTVALILSCTEIENPLWWPIAIPIWIVLFFAWLLSLYDRHTFKADEHEEQLRFARSFGISSALLAFVLTAREVDQQLPIFWANYAVCLIQVAVFLTYTWARGATSETGSALPTGALPIPGAVEEPVKKPVMNFVQFALITTTFLVGASFGLAEFVRNLDHEPPNPAAVHYLYSAIGLYALWAVCIIKWFAHIKGLVNVRVDRPQPQI